VSRDQRTSRKNETNMKIFGSRKKSSSLAAEETKTVELPYNDVEDLLKMKPSELTSKQRRKVRRHLEAKKEEMNKNQIEEETGASESKDEEYKSKIKTERKVEDDKPGEIFVRQEDENVQERKVVREKIPDTAIASNAEKAIVEKENPKPSAPEDPSPSLEPKVLNSKERRMLRRQLEREGSDEKSNNEPRVSVPVVCSIQKGKDGKDLPLAEMARRQRQKQMQAKAAERRKNGVEQLPNSAKRRGRKRKLSMLRNPEKRRNVNGVVATKDWNSSGYQVRKKRGVVA